MGLNSFADLVIGLLEGDGGRIAQALERESVAREKRERREAEIESWRKDFLGNSIPPHMYTCYSDCSVCGQLVWQNSVIIDMCPHCVMALPEFVLEISFGHSKSKKYRTALKRARKVSTYKKVGDVHTFRFETLGEFSDQRHAVCALLLVVFRWMSTSITLNGNRVTTNGINSLAYEIDRLRDNAKSADIAFQDGIIVFTPKYEMDCNESCVHPKEIMNIESIEVD